MNNAPKDHPPYDLLIKQVRVVRPHGNVAFDADIAIAGGKVAKVAPGIHISQAKALTTARAAWLSPGWWTPTCTPASIRRWQKMR